MPGLAGAAVNGWSIIADATGHPERIWGTLRRWKLRSKASAMTETASAGYFATAAERKA